MVWFHLMLDYPFDFIIGMPEDGTHRIRLFIEKWVILRMPRMLLPTYTSENTQHSTAITNRSVGD